uniref:Uncharacterized protein n=1 Tax=viral metagenome TaxID=1070528 RepID=A0A6C0IIB9_9ZZZZ
MSNSNTNDTFCTIADKVGQALATDPTYIEKYPELYNLIHYPGPNPPSLWTRSYTDCVNCQNNYCDASVPSPNPTGYPPAVCDCTNTTYITSKQLDMRRKAEIFKYKINASDQTKKQRYALIAKGINQYRKKCWATQSEGYTNPNVNGLVQAGNTLICGTDTQAAQNIAYCSPTTNNDVPGPITTICYDKSIPLTNYVVRRIYTFNGTKWPQTAWQPGYNGFPIGKAGNGSMFNLL